MEVFCYVCHNKTKNWAQNLVEVKSKHSRTSIAEFLKKFLDDYPTDRNLYHQGNCICNECVSKIYAYDWTCIKAKEQETELRNILLKTETVFKNWKFSGSLKNGGANGNEVAMSGPFNPLNGVVHIIDAEDYNIDDQTDDKVDIKAEMDKYSPSKSTTTASEPEIQVAPVVVVRRKPSNMDVKPDPTITLCDIKPTIEKQMTITLSQPQPQQQRQQQQQQQPKTVTPKIEPVKKGKPIIVRVVKRVPFLKSQPSNTTSQPISTTSQPNTATTAPSSGPSSVNGTATTEEAPKPTVKTSPVKKKTAVGKQIPVCKYCDGRFPNVKILQNHMRLHTKFSGSITCHICLYHMNGDKDSFKAHVKQHSTVPPKHCVLCSEGDAEGFDLRQHVQTNHSDANLLCDLCGKTFSYTSALSKHRKSHFDDRLEQCPQCPKAFKLKRSLKEHLDTHLNTEPAFACSFCDRRFKRKDHCRVHERRHRGDTKKFKCTLCTAAFEYKHDFNLHLQRKHDAELPHDKRR